MPRNHHHNSLELVGGILEKTEIACGDSKPGLQNFRMCKFEPWRVRCFLKLTLVILFLFTFESRGNFTSVHRAIKKIFSTKDLLGAINQKTRA